MTPPRIDTAVIQVRLRTIRELLADLDDLDQITGARLESERGTRHIVERILTAVVDLAVSINSHIAAARAGESPVEYAESFHAAARAGALTEELARELAPSARMRNLLVHQYLSIDVERVAEAAAVTSDAYGRYVSAIARFLETVGADDQTVDPSGSAGNG